MEIVICVLLIRYIYIFNILLPLLIRFENRYREFKRKIKHCLNNKQRFFYDLYLRKNY